MSVAVITGAGSGVGRAIALKFLGESWNVGLVGRRQEVLDETGELAGEAAANRIAKFSCDISDPAAVPTRLGFPVPTEGGAPFDDDERFFEPWWPGAQAFFRRVGSHVEMRTEHLSEPLAAFPELRDVLRDATADGVIVEGTLLALDGEGRPDARLCARRRQRTALKYSPGVVPSTSLKTR